MKAYYSQPVIAGQILHDAAYGIVRVISCRKVNAGVHAGDYLVKLSKT